MRGMWRWRVCVVRLLVGSVGWSRILVCVGVV
nr:MAG TPA: hypothetical protein [Caudoviricetes sp.]